MCRLLGIVCNDPVDFKLMLRDAPKSLSFLSKEHPHGWGIAVFDPGSGWSIDKAPQRALDDQRFHAAALQSRGISLVAHVRQRTVGPLSFVNTHPFVRDGWVFCHNGTIADIEFLRQNASPRRLGELGGETDSELLLAYLLSRLDEEADLHVPDERFSDCLIRASRVLRARPGFGAFNYLLGNGRTLFAHRFGRTLYVLDRQCVLFVASEPMTEEPWQLIEEGSLLRFDRDPTPICRFLAA